MKFQQRDFQREGGEQDRLQASVMAALKEAGVDRPQVKMTFFDAIIEGEIADEEAAEAALRLIEEKAPPVRILPAHNQLVMRGWMVLERQGDTLSMRGLLPEAWTDELLENHPDAQRGEVKHQRSIRWEADPVGWGLFVDRYFEVVGDRRIEARAEKILLSGEATPTLARQWLQTGEGLLSDGQTILDDFTLFPSVWHFPSRKLESGIEGEQVLDLRRNLAASEIRFGDGEAGLPSGGIQLAPLAGVLIRAPQTVSFVIGGRAEANDRRLARERAEVVKRLLVEQGASAKRLEVVDFEPTSDEESAGLVEILIR